jgi:hypothetical protein
MYVPHDRSFPVKKRERGKTISSSIVKEMEGWIQKIKCLQITAVSCIFFSIASSPLDKILITDVLSILENTSICCAAVVMLVISPWYPASEIS